MNRVANRVRNGVGTVLAAALFLSLGIFGCAEKTDAPAENTETTSAAEPKGKVVDGDYVNNDGELLCPVMNVVVASKEDTFGISEVDGVTYYFCCTACKPMFDKEPAKYAVAP